MSKWKGYKTVVESPNSDGWVARDFDENWSDDWWPRRLIQPVLDAFYELHPQPPVVGYGYSIVLDSDLGAFKLDALSAPEMFVRVTGPLHPQAVEWVREQYPERYLEMEVVAEPIH
jgi:hypothetical protein